jgi:alkanesulfonate monooxygenase SsuD/methylene tetrahydromethanopterin reductase-like flavin-dependent oxidoreductase (luciferase family)
MGANLLLPIHTRTPEQVSEYARAYWSGLEEHDRGRVELGLLVPMHLAATTPQARSRAADGVMSYFKTIAAMRSDYIDWLTRRGLELPARLGKSGAVQPVTYETVCAQHAVVGDSHLAIDGLRRLAEQTGAGHFLVWMNIGSVPHRWVLDSMRQFAEEVMPRF